MQRSRSSFATVCALAVGVSLALAAGAAADPPGWPVADGPKIGGSAQVGATLSSDTQLRCQPACTYTIEWLSCTGPSAGGATSAPACEIRWARPAPPTYTVGRDDQGRYVQFHVFVQTETCDEEGECTSTHEEGYSPTVGPMAAAPVPPELAPTRPQNSAPPTISGQAEHLQTLTANPGSWTGTVPIAFSFQWQRCSGATAECAAISGATKATYQVRRADIGARIAVSLTAANPVGSTTLMATPTARVVRATPRPGHDVLDVEELLPADGLVIKSIQGPRVVRSRSGVLLRVTITDRRGFLIEGASIKAAGKPGAVIPVKETTGTRGVAYLQVTLGPRAGSTSRLVLTITASKPGVKSLTATKRIVLRVSAL